MNIALTNLGKYNEGVLDFVWLTLPATSEEIAKAFDQIQVSHDDIHYYSDGLGHVAKNNYYGEYEEFFITDYECDYMDIGEYDNLEDLNEIAETVENLAEYEQTIVKALLDDGYSLEQALDQKDDCVLYNDCDSMTDVAYYCAEEYGILDRIPDELQQFFDFEAYGRYLETSGHWISTNDGYIEVIE